MKQLSDCAYAEIKINGEWTRVHWEQLDEGDIIRFRRPDGSEFVDDHRAGDEHLVTQTPYVHSSRMQSLGPGERRVLRTTLTGRSYYEQTRNHPIGCKCTACAAE